MAVVPLPIAKPKLLLGEGTDEVRFFDALFRFLGIVDIQTEAYAGKNNLGSFLRALVGMPRQGFNRVVSIGLTRDADADLALALQSVCTALRGAGMNVPSAPNVTAPGHPSLRVFVLPDNTRAGMLEDLCLASVRTLPAYQCVDDYFRCLAAAGRSPNSLSKARVHAWLASEAEPDRRLGEAADAGYWPWSDPAFRPLIDFVKSL